MNVRTMDFLRVTNLRTKTSARTAAPMAAANEVLQFVIVSPADGTNAAVNWRDYGRSRWQLLDKLQRLPASHKGRSTYFAVQEREALPTILFLQRGGPQLWPISEATAGGRGDCLLGCCGRGAYQWLRLSPGQSESGTAVACLGVRC
jgi:hypothetical protein